MTIDINALPWVTKVTPRLAAGAVAHVSLFDFGLKKLGKTQLSVLRSFQYHGSWYPGAGWIWSNTSRTLRVCESLVRAGYIEKKPPNEYYGDKHFVLAAGIERKRY